MKKFVHWCCPCCCAVYSLCQRSHAQKKKQKSSCGTFGRKELARDSIIFGTKKIAQYNEMHPNVEIERVLVPQDEYLGSKLTTAFATNSGQIFSLRVLRL